MRSFDAKKVVGALPDITDEDLERLSENVVGAFPLPLSIVKMTVNGHERLVPLVTEEAGVVAGIAKAAKLVSPEGFKVGNGPNVVRSIALIADVDDIEGVPPWPREFENHNSPTNMLLDEFRRELVRENDPFRRHGGGLVGIKARRLHGDIELLLSCNTAEAMGARRVTEVAERAAHAFVERWGGTVVGAIVANIGSGRFVFAQANWNISAAMTLERAHRVAKLSDWAERSEFRVDTHNKGLMNGLLAAATAFGQDTRAIQAANAIGRPLSWLRVEKHHLAAGFDPIIPCATVGGATQHPMAIACRRIAGIKDADDLATVVAAAGLASNFASLLQMASPEGFSATYEKLRR